MLLQDYYSWSVKLDNGNIINQSKKDAKETFRFESKNENFNKIKTFSLISPDKSLKNVSLNIPKNARLIYFRRTISNTGNLFPKFQINMIGWQKTIGNVNFKFISYIFPDGAIEISEEDEPKYTDIFIESLPKKNKAEKNDCVQCAQRLIKPKK